MVICKIRETTINITTEEIQLYDADKTGQPDFALESAGGTVLSIRNTEIFLEPPLIVGTSAGPRSHSAKSVIQANVLPGECWAFKGSKGAVVIQLTAKIHITGASVEHIPAILSPTGETSSAPKDFSIWGLTCLNDNEEKFLGQFSYNNSGSHIQYFEIKTNTERSFYLVEIKIHSNHGDPRFTCVYRIRIHGKPEE